jgi:predicted nucleic acid-binding protein
MVDAAKRGHTLCASALTRVEVLAGMRAKEEVATRRLFAALEWVDVDESRAELAGLLARQYLRSHPNVDPVDYVIAATVQSLDASLWTKNVKHFPMIESLEPPY